MASRPPRMARRRCSHAKASGMGARGPPTSSRERAARGTIEFSDLGRATSAQNGWAQYSVGMAFPCLIVMSWGEIGADVWVTSILPTSFGLANVEIDHTAAIAATTTIAAATMILRISCHLACDETARCI